MRLLAPDLSADASREIEAAIRAPADKPIQLQGLVTADLTAALAAAYPKGLVYDDTVGQPYFSNGSAWLTFSLSTHTHSNVTDGDKGDITVSGGTWTIDNDAVTYAKIQNVSATDKLLGRSTAGSGDVEEIACTSAGRALIDDADASAQRTTLGLGTAATKNTGTSGNNVPLLDGDNTFSNRLQVTYGDGNFDVTDGTNLFAVNLRANSGKTCEFTFAESGVANRWAMGCKPADATLYLTASNTIVGSSGHFRFGSSGDLECNRSIKSIYDQGGIGYATGAGGTVTQITSKSTSVALTKICGKITMHNAALAAATIVSFTCTAGGMIGAGDVIVANHTSGGTLGAYTVNARQNGGDITFDIRNNTAGSLSEAIVIQYAVIRGVTS